MTALTVEDSLRSNGFAHIPQILAADECAGLIANAEALAATDSIGTRRLLELDWCQALARTLRDRLQILLPAGAVAVQCTYFEKSRDQNWLVPVHQDLALPLLEEADAPGFGPWSRKEGELFAHAPADVLEQLVAVRVHLDPCTEVDGPLHVVSGSHAHGIINAHAAVAMKSANGTTACVAVPGDAIIMRPLLLHASSKATGTSLRRVLHFLYGPTNLPGGVKWRHAI